MAVPRIELGTSACLRIYESRVLPLNYTAENASFAGFKTFCLFAEDV